MERHLSSTFYSSSVKQRAMEEEEDEDEEEEKHKTAKCLRKSTF